MLTRRHLAGLPLAATLSVLQIRASQAQQTGGRSAEVQALKAFAEQTHPRGRHAAADADWTQRCEALTASADTLGAARYVGEVMRLLSWFADGHTRVFAFSFPNGAFSLDLPIRTSIHADGLWIDWAESRRLVGARIVRVADTPIAEVIRSFAEIWPKDNVAWAHRWAPEILHSPGMLHALGVISGDDDAPVSIEAQSPRGDMIRVALRPRSGVHNRRGRDRGYNEVLSGPDQGLGVRDVDGRALLLTIDAMADVPGKTFETFAAEVDAALRATTADRVIIDLRRNSGGNNFNGEPIRHRLQQSRFNRAGGLYVLIGPRTFSAAQCLVTRLERESYVLAVGEPTGCSPNHFGDARSFDGAVSGLRASVSSLNWQDMPPFDRRRWTAPDIPVPSLRADAVAGRDAALAAALSDQRDAAWSDDRLSGPWARSGQDREWRPFWLA